MRYADQHVHCTCSFDAAGTLPEMAAAAERRGLRAVCFTDHVDMADARTGETAPDWEQVRGKLLAREAEHAAFADGQGVEVRFGMELGEPCQAPETAAEAAGTEGLDLVIASVHNLPHTPDFYFYDYHSEAECEELNRRYLTELLRTAEMDCFDVLGHIGYTSRYMAQRGFRERITVAKYGDELRAILLRLIENGRGIECNGSGFRGGGSAPFPDRDVLTLYRELGGEIITVGSDAHDPTQIGMGVEEVNGLLQSCGFLYVTEFRRRNPLFITLT